MRQLPKYIRPIACALVAVAWCAGISSAQAPLPGALNPEDRAQIDKELKQLADSLASIRPAIAEKSDLWADAQVFVKGVAWALRYEPSLTTADVALIRKALGRGKQRLDALASGKHPWSSSKGKLVRGYVSAVDGSVQPYRLTNPANYDPAKPIRLDVALHGSMRSVGLSELRWMDSFDDGDENGKAAPERTYIELQPLGRVGENAYRFEGETDVFEAIEAVCRNCNIDRDRVVLAERQQYPRQPLIDALCRGNKLPPQPRQRPRQRPFKTRSLPPNSSQAGYNQRQHEPITPLHRPGFENRRCGVFRRQDIIGQNDWIAKLQYRNEEKESGHHGKNLLARMPLRGSRNIFLSGGHEESQNAAPHPPCPTTNRASL